MRTGRAKGCTAKHRSTTKMAGNPLGYTDGAQTHQHHQWIAHEKRPNGSTQCHATSAEKHPCFNCCDRPFNDSGACNQSFSGCDQLSNRSTESLDAAGYFRRAKRNLIDRADPTVNTLLLNHASKRMHGSEARRRQEIGFFGFISSPLFCGLVCELGPDLVPIMRTQILARNTSTGCPLNCDTSLNGNGAYLRRPLPYELRLRSYGTGQFSFASVGGKISRQLHGVSISASLN